MHGRGIDALERIVGAEYAEDRRVVRVSVACRRAAPRLCHDRRHHRQHATSVGPFDHPVHHFDARLLRVVQPMAYGASPVRFVHGRIALTKTRGRDVAGMMGDQPDIAVNRTVLGHLDDQFLDALVVARHHELADPLNDGFGVEAQKCTGGFKRVVRADQIVDVSGKGDRRDQDDHDHGAQLPDESRSYVHARPYRNAAELHPKA